MRFCTRCGRQSGSSRAFCVGCGNPLRPSGGTAEPLTPEPLAPGPPGHESPPASEPFAPQPPTLQPPTLQ
ncbi:MAG: hypothetical protein ACRDRJ_50370, partial [Streptosporangiaceae bacterium]